MKKILDHFCTVDPKIYALLVKYGVEKPRKSTDLFSDLCETIIGQQLSGKAAETIFSRFKKLFPGQKITPKNVLSLSNEKIRTCGTSNSKVQYLKNIAQEIVAGNLILENLTKLPDEKVKEQLLRVKGIGNWTTEMFMMFCLGRENVFSLGDAGLRRAINLLYQFKKEPSPKTIEKIIKRWVPYQTYACLALWNSVDNR